MMDGKSKLMQAQAAHAAAQSGNECCDDEELDQKRKDRGYNPIDDAERGSVSSKLNEDAARYRKGPSPL